MAAGIADHVGGEGVYIVCTLSPRRHIDQPILSAVSFLSAGPSTLTPLEKSGTCVSGGMIVIYNVRGRS